MFSNQDNNIIMLEGAYKKLKSYFYYDKTLLYIKYKIAQFEYDQELFSKTFNELSNNLQNNNLEYFAYLVDKCSFKALPKKMISNLSDNNVLRTDINRSKDIEQINYYIDVPIELLIIDMLWMLHIGRIAHDNNLLSDHSYAGRFKKGLFNNNNPFGIELKSNRCFEPYFSLYSKWRNNAFKTVELRYDSTDCTMINLDLKGFYYSVRFDFDSLPILCHNDSRLAQLEFLTSIIRKIYIRYSKTIRKYRKGIPDNSCIFPIGLLSPIVLRDLYLKKFDEKMLGINNLYYYGRYVDDLLLVVNATDMEDFTAEKYIETYLISNKIVMAVGENGYKFIDYPNLHIQNSKINCIFFKKSFKEDPMIEIYKDRILVNSSEANLIPDVDDLLNKPFITKAYTIENLERSHKIRDFGLMEVNNLNAVLRIRDLTKYLKNTVVPQEDIRYQLTQILEFYKGSNCIEYNNLWRSIFELFVISNNKELANSFYKSILSEIENLTFDHINNDEIFSEFKTSIIKKVKLDLKEHLNIALSLSISLDYSMGKKPIHKNMALIFRKANFINHSLITLPLMNYMPTDFGQSLISSDVSKYIDNGSETIASLGLDELKLKWTPRYVHLDEIYLYLFYNYISKDTLLSKISSVRIFNEFKKINALEYLNDMPIQQETLSDLSDINVLIRNIAVQLVPKPTYKIALVNTYMEESIYLDGIDNPELLISKHHKDRLFRIMRLAVENKVDYIVFPEFYLPFSWIGDMLKFSRNHKIAIVSGLQYIKRQNRIFNTVCVISPLYSNKKYITCPPIIREKNYYAPSEQTALTKLGYYCQDKTKPLYNIIQGANTSMSTILCFEFTDIFSRAALKSKINMLFVPQLNRDTNYFSSIVESSARDLHTFVIQSNTSKYGDSRISAPYKTNYKNIVQVKGGINDSIIIGEIAVEELNFFRSTYPTKYNSQVFECFNCKKVKKKTQKQIRDYCKQCPKAIPKVSIKNVPPNF